MKMNTNYTNNRLGKRRSYRSYTGRKRNNLQNRIILISAIILMIGISIVSIISTMSALSGSSNEEQMMLYTEQEVALNANPGREMRGVWIATVNNLNFPSKAGLSGAEQKAELDAIINTCKEANLNAIFFQVRPTADALYDSAYFPTSKYLTDNQGDHFKDKFDPLKYIIQVAHENDIEVHAWVNPYRVTYGTAANPAHDLTALAKNHPARVHPDYVVKYADGQVYFNPGLPQVQKLVTNGVLEIVRKYNIDGIHFDDYFYPYPAYETIDEKSVKVEFNDAEAYKKYGSNYSSVEEFRRSSINTLVKSVYTEIKKLKPEVRFGISPFGIWANKTSSTPTGSDTTGFESYHSLYSDAKAWVEGGYIDYLCPQIYWAFDTKAARYDILVRWWSTLLDGTGVDLYVGHAAYKLTTDFKNDTEIPRQIEYARNYISVKGSVFYGYKDVAANNYKVKDKLHDLYASELILTNALSNGSDLIIGKPVNETNLAAAYGQNVNNVYVMGMSDPAYPVYYKSAKVTRTKSGFFSVYASLQSGKNNLNFVQNSKTLTHVLYNGSKPASSMPYNYPKMDSYKIELISPADNVMNFPGEKVQIRVQAPSKSTVTAKLGGTTVTLTPLTSPPDQGSYMLEVYSGTITLPDTKPNGKLIDLGNITFTATRQKDETATLTGPNVKLINDTLFDKPIEVINDYSHLKVSTTSTFYNDYLPSSVGMRDIITGFKDGYYQLRFGGYIHHTNVKLLTGKTLADNTIKSALMKNSEATTDIIFATAENVPVNAKCLNGVFTVTLFNTELKETPTEIALVQNPVFKANSVSYDEEKKTVTYKFTLINADNFYGFDVAYDNGKIVIKVKNPRKKSEGEKPLEGLTIAVDAGHGGNDTGALGFLGTEGKNEKDLNLEIALVVQKKLTALGANVVMIRSEDETIELINRAITLSELKPDLCVSIHHNSMPDTSNNALTRGLLVLYCDDSGRLLAKSCSSAISAELNRYERDVKYQALAIARNHKFPTALFEMAFITNPDEYEVAVKPSTVEKSAEGITKGVIAWLDNQAKYIS